MYCETECACGGVSGGRRWAKKVPLTKLCSRSFFQEAMLPPHRPDDTHTGASRAIELTAVSSSQTAPPDLVLSDPAEAVTKNVVAMIADFMFGGEREVQRCG